MIQAFVFFNFVLLFTIFHLISLLYLVLFVYLFIVQAKAYTLSYVMYNRQIYAVCN